MGSFEPLRNSAKISGVMNMEPIVCFRSIYLLGALRVAYLMGPNPIYMNSIYEWYKQLSSLQFVVELFDVTYSFPIKHYTKLYLDKLNL